MKIANINGRAGLVLGDQAEDVAQTSSAEFGPDPMNVYRNWTAFTEFATSVSRGTGPLVEASLRNPVP
jgi:2,4-didehydro-3-deoxy-L-rhamnonate hydrolase